MPDYASVHKELQRSGCYAEPAVAGILRPVPGGGRDSIPINPVQQEYYADYLAKVNATMPEPQPGEVMQVDWAFMVLPLLLT